MVTSSGFRYSKGLYAHAYHDALQENLRQLCVYKLANESGRPWVWWDYTTRFADECKMSDNNYGEDCAERVSPPV